MATNFPTSLDAYTNPAGTDQVSVVDHALQHSNHNDAIEAIEAKLGIDGSVDTASVDYILTTKQPTGNYITGLTGDGTASGPGSVALTLATVNSDIGTFNNITINAKGLATAGSNVAYLTGNQTITLSGDITGSGATSITTTLATVNSNVGSFGSATQVGTFTVNAKGLTTAASNVTITPNFANVLGGTAGSVMFSNGTNLAQDNTNFHYDQYNYSLSLGHNSPAERLDILGNALLTKTGTATVGHQTYDSNEYKLQGSQWFTSGSVAKTLTGGMTIKPRNPGAIVTSTLDFGYAIDSSTERPVISYKVGDHYNDGFAGQLTLRSGYWDGIGSFATGYGSAFGGMIETQYDGTFAFRPVGGSGTTFSGMRALSFGTHPTYASFWSRWGYGGGSVYDADIRTSFNGSINIGAGQPAWYTPSPGAGATGSELLNITIGSQIINNLTSRQTLLVKNIASQTADSLVIQNSSATVLTRFDVNGYLGIGVAPTAYLHLKAGTATASTAPLKFTSGTLNTTAEAGAVEFLTDKFYGTITTGAARKELTLNDVALTSGRVPFVTTNGRLTDDADFTFATDTLTVTKTRTTRIKGTSSAPSIAGGAGAGTSPTVSITGTDLAGEITVTTDADPTTSAVFCTVTFTSAFGTAPYVVFAPSNDNSANAYRNGEPLYVNSNTTTFTLNTNSVASPQGGTEYKYTYQVIE